jgi:hypothetical protein
MRRHSTIPLPLVAILLFFAISMARTAANGQTATSGPLDAVVLSAAPGKVRIVLNEYGAWQEIDGVNVVLRLTNHSAKPLIDGFMFSTTWLKSDGKPAFRPYFITGPSSLLRPLKVSGTLPPGGSIKAEIGLPTTIQSFSHYTLRINFFGDLLTERCQEEINGDAPGPPDPRCKRTVTAHFQALARIPQTKYMWLDAPWLYELPETQEAYAKVLHVGTADTHLNPSLAQTGSTDRHFFPDIIGKRPVTVQISLLCTAPGGPPNSDNGTQISVDLEGKDIRTLEQLKRGPIVMLEWGLYRGVRFLKVSPVSGDTECPATATRPAAGGLAGAPVGLHQFVSPFVDLGQGYRARWNIVLDGTGSPVPGSNLSGIEVVQPDGKIARYVLFDEMFPAVNGKMPYRVIPNSLRAVDALGQPGPKQLYVGAQLTFQSGDNLGADALVVLRRGYNRTGYEIEPVRFLVKPLPTVTDYGWAEDLFRVTHLVHWVPPLGVRYDLAVGDNDAFCGVDVVRLDGTFTPTIGLYLVVWGKSSHYEGQYLMFNNTPEAEKRDYRSFCLH